MHGSLSRRYGYDNRIEVFGSKGMLSVQTPHALSYESADQSGFHKSQLEFSFPQRFNAAFAAEVDLFASVVLKVPGATWPVSREDCIAAQEIASLGAHSNATGKVCMVVRQLLPSWEKHTVSVSFSLLLPPSLRLSLYVLGCTCLWCLHLFVSTAQPACRSKRLNPST